MNIFDQLLFEISSRMEEAEREKDVKDIMGSIRLSQELLRSDKYFPCMFIAEGISTYIKGFYVASIFYSSLSVEMGLLIEVSKKLAGINDEDERKLRRIGGLIEEAYGLGILDGEHRQLAHKIRKLRNCYVHYYNILHYHRMKLDFLKRVEAALTSQSKMDENMKRQLQELKEFIENLSSLIPSKEEQRRAIQTIIEITEKSTPNIAWAAKSSESVNDKKFVA